MQIDNNDGWIKTQETIGKTSVAQESVLDKLDPKGLRHKPIAPDSFESTTTTQTQKPKHDGAIDLLKMLFGKFEAKNKIPVPEEPFESLELARKYANSKALEALHSDNPHEYKVVIDKNTNKILGEYKGDKYSVSAGLETFSFPEDNITVHGHPTYVTENGRNYSTPISFSDFRGLCSFGAECTALNPDGEYSTLIKKPDFKERSPEVMKYYETLHLDMVYGDLYEKNKHMLHPLVADCENITQLFSKLKQLKELGITKEQALEIKESIHKVFPKDFEKVLDLNCIKNIHKFWQKYADELGMIYKTNYSYLE